MKIVIVGGGFAGVKSALELARNKQCTVQLISKGADFEYHGALYRSATGRSPLEVVIRLGSIFEHAHNVEVIVDEITALNPRVKAVKGATGRVYTYDKLLLSVGNAPNYFDIEGLEKFSHTMYTIHDTTRLRTALVGLFKKSSMINPRVVIVGGGATGVELAGEMQHFAQMVADKYHTPVVKVDVDLIEASERILPNLLPKASTITQKHLRKLGVNLFVGRKVLKATQHYVQLDDQTRSADILVWTAGSKAVGLYAKYPDIFEFERGRVKVDEYLHVPAATDIYVLGDNAQTPYSGMAQTALYDALYVSKCIRKELMQKPITKYSPKQPIYVVPVGPKWAVVQQGKRVRSGAYGWTVRRRADLYIFKNFQPFKVAIKTWRKGNNLAKF